MDINKYIDRGHGHLSLTTLKHYEQVYERYEQLRNAGKSHIEACEQIGISERHMYRVIQIVS